MLTKLIHHVLGVIVCTTIAYIVSVVLSAVIVVAEVKGAVAYPDMTFGYGVREMSFPGIQFADFVSTSKIPQGAPVGPNVRVLPHRKVEVFERYLKRFPPPQPLYVASVHAGFPLLAVSGEEVVNARDELSGAVSLRHSVQSGFVRFASLRPHVAALLINGVCYYTLAGLLVYSSRRVIANIRLRQGKCPRCGYPQSEGVCAECGLRRDSR